jgi:hypothetical protein
MLSTLSATYTRRLYFYIIHVSIYIQIVHMSICLIIVECEVSTTSTAGIKFIASTFRHSVEDKSTVSNTVGPATQLYVLY